jgi:hypothetical protein
MLYIGEHKSQNTSDQDDKHQFESLRRLIEIGDIVKTNDTSYEKREDRNQAIP